MPATALPFAVRRTAQILARIGAASRGILYALIGIITTLAAGGLHRASGPKETLVDILAYPGGRPFLLLLACGFAAFAVFHLLNALLNLDGHRKPLVKVSHRFVALCLALTYGSLAYFTLHLCVYPTTREPHNIHDNITTLLELPTGRIVLVAIAVGIGGFGGFQLYRACRALPDNRLTHAHQGLLRIIARIGLVGRGVLFLGIAVLLGRVAFDNNAEKAGGIGATLRTLQSHPSAKPLLLTIGLALIAFGIIDILAPHPQQHQA